LYKKCIKEKSIELRALLNQKYKTYKNKLTAILRTAEKQYYQNKLVEVKDNMSKTWKVLNSMMYRNSKFNKLDEIEINGSSETDPKKMADNFNDFFVNIGPNLAKKIPKSSINANNFLKGDYSQSFFTTPVSDLEITSIINSLKNTSSKGYDDIPGHLIKFCVNELSGILAHINNASLSTGVFPDALKLAKIVPIFKNGDKKIVSNYRPISVLSSFSKIFEKIMYVRLENYLQTNSILHQSQYGFRKKMSTSMALLSLTEEISRSMDNKNFTIGVFIDLAKAFDTVNHKILLEKLKHYGLRGTTNDWFKSYLENRKQFVVINKTSSNCSTIACGVPQGSILGPLLFILYINDLNTVSDVLRTIMFADDTNLFLTGKNLDEIKIQFNEKLKTISLWFQTNLLSLNVSKTSYIVFTNGVVSSNIDLFIDDVKIDRVFETKFLGVVITHRLSWKPHIAIVCSKMSKNIGIIAKVRHLLPQSHVRLLYLTLVQPYMNYCCIVWSGTDKTDDLDRIHKIQKRYCRLITFSNTRAHAAPLFKILKFFTIYQMYTYHVLLFMYKNLNNIGPGVLFSFQMNMDVHSHFTRQHCRLHTAFCRTRTRQRTLHYQGPKIWNDLPHDMKTLRFSLFKRRIKNYILNQ